MPEVKVRDIKFYYDTRGTGYPLVLIRGLGSNADHWYPQVPAFSSFFRVVSFDNRGIGRSHKPDNPCTISTMAEDTAGIMDAIGIPKAHIMGLSMGGMIAQEFALRFPHKVQGLVLACTHCGGGKDVPPSEEIRTLFSEFIATASPEAARKAGKCLFAEDTFRKAPELVREYQQISANFPPKAKVLLQQWEAVKGHDTWARLHRIKAPTLVITGAEDLLIAPENSKILAEKIPEAQLCIIPGGGHQFLVEQAHAANEAILKFLKGLATKT
jgi:pimeloyl-ACP methyl ester carboxylesterase